MASIISMAFIIFLSYFVLQGAPTSCPSSFRCATLGVLGYPFTTSFSPSCGLCVLNCTEPTPTIGLTNSGPWYDVLNSFSNNRSFLVGDSQMLHLLNNKCDVIQNRFRLPTSSSVSFTVLINKTVWYCPAKFDVKTGNRSGTLRRLTNCVDHNVYHVNDISIPGCDVVQYPTLVMVDLSDQCSQCISESGSCQDLPNDGFRCINKRKERFNRWLLLASGASALLLVILIPLVIYARRRIASKFTILWTTTAKGNQNMEAFLKIYGSLSLKRYTYSDIKQMTNSFKHKIGEGGYGTVYKGKLQDGRFVAVKKLKNMKGNGEEFINEVVSISRTNHVNVVSLLGFCSQGNNKRALVYEFMPNGSLEKYLCHVGTEQSLALETLVYIAVGVARGLDYLHRGCNARILHFDIKPHNILLDQDFCPKISDFGLAKLSDTNNSMTSMLEARGTIGYIAPEVFNRNFGGVSHKSDVYSYGMLVLDMACGRKNLLSRTQNSSEQYFPDWIYQQIELQEEIGVHGIIDDGERGLVRKMILVGLWCIQTYPSNRPSMNGVVEMLEGELETIKMPPKPHLCSPPRPGIQSFSTLVNTP